MLVSTLSFGQQWSRVLSSNRAINWSNAGLPATLPDGETTPNPWTPPTRGQSGATITPSGNAATDLTNINNALSNCPDGKAVILGAGSFQIQGTIVAYKHSCSLRGSGPQSTTLRMTGSGAIWMGASSAGGTCTVSSGTGAGSSSIVCGSLAGNAPIVGDIVSLSQCDTGFSGATTCTGTSVDNGGLFVCADNVSCMTQPSGSGRNRSQVQTFRVTSVSANGGTYTVGVSPSIYMPNWSTARSATLTWNDRTYNGTGVGIENMTIFYSGSSSVNFDITMGNTYASWVKGVRFVGAPVISPLNVSGSKNALVSNNYFFSNLVLNGTYPPAMQTDTSSDTLILNNIMTSGVPWEGNGGITGLVFAYNYGRDTFTLYNENSTFDHHGYSSFELFEGNQMGQMLEDATWGTHNLNTYFRNYVPCWDAPYNTFTSAGVPRGIAIDRYHRFTNLVGNAIGTASQCSTYQGDYNAIGSIFRIDTYDPLVSSTLFRWGNATVAKQAGDSPANSGVRFLASEVPSTLSGALASLSNIVPQDTSLPCSMFFPSGTSCTPSYGGGSGLSWWNVCTSWSSFPTSCAGSQAQPFPMAGPELVNGPYVNGHAYDIPAAVAWLNLPIDTSLQNSYTVTSSSWANGVMTLTVAGLPAGSVHIMGPFQLAGVSSACMAGATVGASNELLMTGSNASTVSYALPSNPGTGCTGTMKFPDVRQFDERVYQSDSGTPISGGLPAGGGGTGGIAPPAGLVASVR